MYVLGRVLFVLVALQGQKKALDPLEVELQEVAGCRVSAGTKPMSSSRTDTLLQPPLFLKVCIHC